MKIEYRKHEEKKILPMWIAIANAFNNGVSPQVMIHNEDYISPRTGRPYSNIASIYYILKQMKKIKI